MEAPVLLNYRSSRGPIDLCEVVLSGAYPGKQVISGVMSFTVCNVRGETVSLASHIIVMRHDYEMR